jgi:hypothetical protein
MTTKQKAIIGRLETISLPELAISDIQVRVDTGAKTSSLHVDNIVKFKKNGKIMVKFDLHPDVYNVEEIVSCESPIHDIRRVKSSNGTSEQRYVILTEVQLGDINWSIEITLTDRSDMSYLMLFGREAIGKRFLVDPSKVFVSS